MLWGLSPADDARLSLRRKCQLKFPLIKKILNQSNPSQINLHTSYIEEI